MITVTYLGEIYECVKALKGADYIHLLDSDGCMIAAFDGVSDFSDFAITGGDWTIPTPEQDCYLAVVKEDGTIGKGGHRCCDIPTETVDIEEVYTALKGDLLLAEPIELSNSSTQEVTIFVDKPLFGKKVEIEYRIRTNNASHKYTCSHRFVTTRLVSESELTEATSTDISWVTTDFQSSHRLYIAPNVKTDDNKYSLTMWCYVPSSTPFKLDIVQICVFPEV